MESRKMEIIKELMEQLQDEMQYGEEDLSMRLGRKKPELEVVKIEGEMPMDEEEDVEMLDDMEDPADSKLKNRLMKLRGA